MVTAAAVLCGTGHASLRETAQFTPAVDVTDTELAEASGGRTVAVRLAGRIESVPLEIYVARVLAGEGEPQAPEATQQALAVAIRTFAIFNTGRHAREGFDLCDATHCQVPRAATAASRRATITTVGRILTYEGAPAEIFYSASCGGRSEAGSAVWPKATHTYLRSIKDDVHDGETPWTIALPLADVEAALAGRGYSGRLEKVEIASRSRSGRAATLRLKGMEPDRITGDQFRAAMGTTRVRSTAFSIRTRDGALQITGRGYGHGVGMCVVGAGHRARRGETMTEILRTYFHGLEVRTLPSAFPESGQP